MSAITSFLLRVMRERRKEREGKGTKESDVALLFQCDNRVAQKAGKKGGRSTIPETPPFDLIWSIDRG